MNAKRISGALMVSLVIHGIIMLIASTVYITQTVRFIECYGDRTPNRKDVVNVEIFPPTKPPRPQVRGGSMAKIHCQIHGS